MIDFDAYVKFSRPGPRYTSYPTAPEFNENFSYETYTNLLKNGDKNRPLSLYFHMPFCRSACYFCGCNVIYTSSEEKKERYLDYINREMDILCEFLDNSRVVAQMHFGGGTPTFFDANQLERHIKNIKKHFKNFSDDAEISCEIDPRFLTKEQLKILVGNGFNRISFGVQDFDDEVQKIIHRVQPFEITQNAVKMAREFGIKSINMDLIYGLPHQNFEKFKNTLKLALDINPDRFAVFNYAHVPWLKKSMRKFDETTLPNPAEKLKILKFTHDFLTKNGYKMIGMDHYAKPQDELFKALKNGSLHRNFQGYTTKGGADLIGIGLTSIGEGENYYAQHFRDLNQYENAIDAKKLPLMRGIKLSDEDLLRKAVIMELMANFCVDILKIEKKFNINFFEKFKDELKDLENLAEFVKISREKISVTPTGTLLIRNIAMCFDEYLKKMSEEKRKFSKTL